MPKPVGGQLGIFSQGNTALKPETAKTWTPGDILAGLGSWRLGQRAQPRGELL